MAQHLIGDPAHTRTYRVTYRVTGREGGYVPVIRRGGPQAGPAGTWTVVAQVTEGYTTLADLPRIIRVAHPRRIDLDQVELLRIDLVEG